MPYVSACPPSVKANNMDAAIAQLRVVELFRADFQGRFPDGIVLSEYEYMGRTTFANAPSGPIQYQNKPLTNLFLSAMSDAFRKFLKDNDFRKPDVIGIAEGGLSRLAVELLEVTTKDNRDSAFRQVRDKVDTLQKTVLKSLNVSFGADIGPSDWRPDGLQNQYPSAPPNGGPAKSIRWICYLPTQALPPKTGVVLYEVHDISIGDPVPVPSLDPRVVKRIRDAYNQRRTDLPDDWWVKPYLTMNPPDAHALEIFAVAVGVGAAIACLAAALDPVPGDEVPICMAAARVIQGAVEMAPSLAVP